MIFHSILSFSSIHILSESIMVYAMPCTMDDVVADDDDVNDDVNDDGNIYYLFVASLSC